MKIQFVEAAGDWSLFDWPHVPSIGDEVILCNEDDADWRYVVRARVWDHDNPECAVVYVEAVGDAWESSPLDRLPKPAEQ